MPVLNVCDPCEVAWEGVPYGPWVKGGGADPHGPDAPCFVCGGQGGRTDHFAVQFCGGLWREEAVISHLSKCWLCSCPKSTDPNPDGHGLCGRCLTLLQEASYQTPQAADPRKHRPAVWMQVQA